MKIIITEEQSKLILESPQDMVYSFLNKFLKYKQDEDWAALISKNETDKYGMIRYDKGSGWCYVNSDLIDFTSEFLSIHRDYVWQGITKWCKDNVGGPIEYFYPPHSIRRSKFLKF